MSMKDFTGVLAEMMGLLDAGAAADKLTQPLRAMKGVLRETVASGKAIWLRR